ncbi:MAG: putative toxin-antitoxin system toxin component, PIN family [Rhodospirillales bacterium]|nr:putative toxin-antitoxin system toxin component, PIN family [Rhodospirillales bacterium]
MRVVIDTNVLVSGLLWHGAPHALIEQAREGRFTIVSSSRLLDELAEVVGRRKFRSILLRSKADPQRMLRELRRLTEVVEAPSLTLPVSRDSDDDAVLAVATTAGADLIVSGDDDLLTLVSYNGIPIVDPAAALARLRGI